MNKWKSWLAILAGLALTVGCQSQNPDDPGESAMNPETPAVNSTTEVAETWGESRESVGFLCDGYDAAYLDPDNNAKGFACSRVGEVLVPLIEWWLEGGTTPGSFTLHPFLAEESVECGDELVTSETYFPVTWCAEGYLALDITRVVNDDIETMRFVNASILWAFSTLVVDGQIEVGMSDENVACMAGILSVYLDPTQQAVEVPEMQNSLFGTEAAHDHFGGEESATELSRLFTDGAERIGCLTG